MVCCEEPGGSQGLLGFQAVPDGVGIVTLTRKSLNDFSALPVSDSFDLKDI